MKQLIILALYLSVIRLSYAQTIAVTGQMGAPRWFHQSQVLNNGKVLVFGGDNGDFLNPIVYKSAQLYTPSTGTWVNTGSLTTQRTDFASTILPNGNVMAIGGTLYIGGPNHLEETKTCEIYDVSSGTWIEARNMIEARSQHKAVLLNSGKVLVVGGGATRCELYVPSLNSWFLTDSTTHVGGDGLSIVTLADGRILATEGYNAEIFDPNTEQWTVLSQTMKGERVDHSSVLLNDGRVLLSGSIRPTDQNTAEIFNPADNSFTLVASMSEFRGNSPAILMDNGKVLAFGIGDYFEPLNTKLIEVYDPVTNVWTTSTYTQLGTQGYTIHKLGTGKILVVGGSWTTGNGASQTCFLIDQGLTGCSTPTLTLPISGSTGCWGSPGNLTVWFTEADVQYQGFMGSTPVTELMNGGGNIVLNVSGKSLVQGKNEISIRAQKLGCPSYTLTTVGTITATNGSIISLSSDKYYLCPGDGATIDGPSGYTSYLWSNGETTEDIYTTEIGSYSLIVSNGGCKSASGQIYISGSPSAVNAGLDQSVCTHTAPYTLVGSPSGGIWSGPGVVSGSFDPGATGAGTHILSYSYCNQTDTRTVVVTQTVVPSVTIAIVNGSNPSPTGAVVKFEALGVNVGASPVYKFKVNNVAKPGTIKTYSSNTLQNNDQVICELTSNATCANPSVVTSNTISMIVGPSPSIISSVPTRNTHTISSSTSIQLNLNQQLNSNSYSDSCLIITGSSIGNQTHESFNYSGQGSNSIIFNPDGNFFAGEKVTVTLTRKAKNEIGIPVLNPLTFRFKTKPSPTAAAFVTHSESFPEIGDNGNFASDASTAYFCNGDFNKDGYLDYAAAFATCKKVMIFFNNGDGTFTKQIQYDNIMSFGITSGDYDKDGDIDIAYGNLNESKIYVLKNDGNGTFTITSFSTASSPEKLVSADLNGDGAEDIVFATRYQYGTKNMYVARYLNGAFVAHYVLQTTDCSGICVEDFDGDYDLDIAVADRNFKVYILPNEGEGIFTNTPIMIQLNDYIGGIAAADFDSDGDMDIACSQVLKGEVLLLKNGGNLSFIAGNKFKVGTEPYNIISEDFDGDGDMDIIAANKLSSSISVRLNDGSGIFSGSLELDVEKPVTGILSGDFDSDQDIDIISATELESDNYSSKHLTIFTFFNKVPIITITPIARNIYCQKSTFNVFFTFDGDFSTTNVYYAELSDANGSFASPLIIGSSKKSPVTCNLPAGITPGSKYRVRIKSTSPSTLSADNGVDIQLFNDCPEITSTSPLNHQIFTSSDNGLTISFSSQMSVDAFQKDKIQIVGDYNGIISETGSFDGNGTSQLTFHTSVPLFAGEKITVVVDSVVSNSTGHPINNKKTYEVYEKSAPARINFEAFTSISNPGSGLHKAKDFDHDYDLDLIILSEYSIDIKKNDGNGNFGSNEKIINLSPNEYVPSFEVFDIENDGDFDIVVTQGSKVLIYHNDGSGALTLVATYNLGKNPMIYGLADFDADGFLDLLIEQDRLAVPTKLQLLKNNGQGGFVSGNVFSPPVANAFSSVDVIDLDNDGDYDFTHWENYGVMYFAINDGWGNFTYRDDSFNIGTYYLVNKSESGDFDKDGDIDLIVSVESWVYKVKNLQVLLNNGAGVFTVSQVITNNPDNVYDFEKSDLDGDNDFDIIAANYGGLVTIWENDGKGEFALKSTLQTSEPAHSFSLAGDLNGDLKMDIALFNHNEHKIKVYLSQAYIDVVSINPGVLCSGSSLNVNFTTNGNFNSGNIFTVQLSDANGNFNTPITIGSVSSISQTTINAVIPDLITAGFGYKIRIVSSNPIIMGAANNSNLTIQPLTIPSVSILAPSNTICPGSTVTFTVNSLNGGTAPTYQWILNNIPITGATASFYTTNSLIEGDEISIQMTSNKSCVTTAIAESKKVVIDISSVNKPGEIVGNSNVIVGSNNVSYSVPEDLTVNYTWSYTGTGVTIINNGHTALLSFSENATSGNLNVVAMNSCGSSLPVSKSITVDFSTNLIQSGVLSAASLYPNPFNSEFSINVNLENENSSTTIILTDVTGKELHVFLKDKNLSSGEYQFYCPDHIQDGIYFVRIISDQAPVLIKCIKQK